MNQLIGQRYGDWYCEQEMGTGGFGCVTAWKNQSIGEKMVIKQCRQKLDARNRERWLEEIHLMNTLKHNNLVAGRPIPNEIEQAINTPEKLLGLEYCESDLRKQLSHRTHCCGLKEKTVLNILRDVSDGLEFLHKKRIVHRDLKPENILLYYGPKDQIIYKITDLGYAKEMDANSLLLSFVGTLQYLAPELYNIESGYTYTADFWSLGTLIFECITGRRPFLLTNKAFDWPKHMKAKSDDHIWGCYKEGKKDVLFSSEIPSPNYLCKPLLIAFCEWLKIVLRHDAKKRGNSPTADGTLLCFAKIREILNMRIINIFSVLDCNDSSYLYCPGDTGLTLKLFIYQEFGIEPKQQLIICPADGSPLLDQESLERFPGTTEGLFLLNTNKHAMYDIRTNLPEKVRELVGDPEVSRKCSELRLYWAQACFFCQKQSTDYTRLLQSQRALILSVKKKWSLLQAQKEQLQSAAIRLESVIDMFKLSIECDYQCLRGQDYGVSGTSCLEEWKRLSEKVYSLRYTEHRTHFEEIARMHDLFTTLQKNPLVASTNSSEFAEITRNAEEKYDKLRQKIRDLRNKDVLHDSKSMAQIVINCIAKTEDLYKGFYHHLKKVMSLNVEMDKFTSNIENIILAINEKIDVVKKQQETRQALLWQFFSKNIPTENNADGPYSNLPSLLLSMLEESFSLQEETNTDSMIHEVNETLQSMGRLLQNEVVSIPPTTTVVKKSKTFDDTLNSLHPRDNNRRRKSEEICRDHRSIDFAAGAFQQPFSPYGADRQMESDRHKYPHPPSFDHNSQIYTTPTDPNAGRKLRNSSYLPGNNSQTHRVSGKYPTNHPSSAPIGNTGGSYGISALYAGNPTPWDPAQISGSSGSYNPSYNHPSQNIDHTVLSSRVVTTQPRDARQYIGQGRPTSLHSPVSPNSRLMSNVPRSPRTNDMTGDRPPLTTFTLGESHQRFMADAHQSNIPHQHNMTYLNLTQKK